MPAVLAEIGFVSNPQDEKRLKTPEYREILARSLLRGVKSYLEALNRTQMRQLTDAARRSTVGGGRGHAEMLATEPAVTWIKVEKPVFDLVGVVLGSFHLAGILLVVAFALGVTFGAALIVSRRRPASTTPLDQVSLHLER